MGYFKEKLSHLTSCMGRLEILVRICSLMLDPFRLVSLPWKAQQTTSIFLRANSCLSSFETGYMKHHSVCLRNLIKGRESHDPISKVLTPRRILPVSWARKPVARTYPCCTGWSGVSHGWTWSSPAVPACCWVVFPSICWGQKARPIGHGLASTPVCVCIWMGDFWRPFYRFRPQVRLPQWNSRGQCVHM